MTTIEEIALFLWQLDLFDDQQMNAFLAAHQSRY